MSLITYDLDAGLASVMLSNTPVNAMSLELLGELANLFERVSNDGTVQAVVLSGTGRVFCAGADTKIPTDVPTMTSYLRLVREGLNAVMDCRKPVVAAVNGHALGIGASLVACCDVIYMADTAMLGFPEVNLGIVGGARYAMRILPHSLMRRMFLSGERVPAAELFARGVIEAALPTDRLLPAACELGRAIASKSPGATKLAKETMNAVEFMTIRDGYRYEQDRIIDIAETADAKEARASYREKRSPVFKKVSE